MLIVRDYYWRESMASIYLYQLDLQCNYELMSAEIHDMMMRQSLQLSYLSEIQIY